MNPPTQAVIFCGGRGERLRPLTDHIPKPLAPVLGRPFLEYLIEQLREAGLHRILLLTGYQGELIADHLGDGAKLGVEIQYMHGPAEWETGRRLAEAAALLDEQFVLMYGDNLAPFRLEPLWELHQLLGLPVTLTVARKEKGNIRLGSGGIVEAYDSTRGEAGLTHVEIGYMLVRRDPVLAMDPARGSFSIVLRKLAAKGELASYDPGCDYHSISVLARLRQTEEFLRPRRLILLDRDGTINRKAPRGEYVSRKEDFVFIPETLSGLRRLAQAGFEFIILSNQAGIGRGVVQAGAVEELHAWMVRELAADGIRIRDVLICPHHWLDQCACRKPKPGLFFEASRRHQFALDRTLYIGDDPRDVQAAWNATCPCVLVGEMHGTPAMDLPPHHKAVDLDAAVPWILERFASAEM